MPHIDPHSFELPAAEIADKVNEALSGNDVIIITAPPSAGKSTLLPITMLSAVADEQKILMLEPRRIAARQIAARMSEMVGEKVGQTIGYRVRFDNCIGKNTRIEVLTEGILTKRLISDNELSDVSIVIFDEFHERSLFADTALALCRECQQILRPDLKIVIMSATIDTSELADKLDATVIESKGRMFPVETIHTTDCDIQSIAQQTAHYIREAHNQNEGDILAFLPGEGEIRKCEEMLTGAFPTTSIYPLYGMLPQAKQREAIMPSPQGQRKIVLATSIAETSLTIEGVRIVVDCGYCKQLAFDANTGLSRLETTRISQDMADQRRGRAGRLTNGICYRLWSKATESRMRSHRTPEIEKADLTQLTLDLAAWGETDVNNLVWLTNPPQQNITQAQELLESLGAIDEQKHITEHGKRLNAFPCHPRIAKMLCVAQSDYEKALATDIAALVEERDPLANETSVDINLRLEALRRYRQANSNNPTFDRIERIASQYRNIVKIGQSNDVVDCYVTGKLIAHAYPERVATAHEGHDATFRLANGTLAKTDNGDIMSREDWIAIAHLDARDGKGKIHLASPVDPTDLNQLIHEKKNVKWDSRAGLIVAQHESRIGKLVVASKPIHNIDRQTIDDAIIQAVKKEGLSMLNWDEDVEQLQNRISSLSQWHPEDSWPDVATEKLMMNAGQWLSPYLGKATTTAELKKIDISEALTYMLDFDKQNELNRLAPTHIKVPSGSNIKLKYQQNGTPPILAVRLQECFGLANTPTVDNGKQKVLMHLLSPGFKPVQITQDLKSFWDNAYFDVKKELKNRYPKHIWPEKPWEEPAIRGIKRNMH